MSNLHAKGYVDMCITFFDSMTSFRHHGPTKPQIDSYSWSSFILEVWLNIIRMGLELIQCNAQTLMHVAFKIPFPPCHGVWGGEWGLLTVELDTCWSLLKELTRSPKFYIVWSKLKHENITNYNAHSNPTMIFIHLNWKKQQISFSQPTIHWLSQLVHVIQIPQTCTILPSLEIREGYFFTK